MSSRIYRSRQEPIREREKLTWEEIWKGPDKGLITAWEIGRKLADEDQELSAKAKRGELPISVWKGGVEKNIKSKRKYGPLLYLAEWHGLRGDDLDIDFSEERELICSKTGVKVIYTNDFKKYGRV